MQPAPSDDEVERKAEKTAEDAYKRRQLEIANAQEEMAKSNRNLTFVLAGFTLLGVLAGGVQAYFAHEGVDAAKKSAKAAEDAAYQACLGAQISRGALLENQSSEADSHGAAVAAVYQAMAATEGERAEMQLILGEARIEVGKAFEIPFAINNAGKTAAINLNSKFRVVFLRDDAEPDFRYPKHQITYGFNSRSEPGRAVINGEMGQVVTDSFGVIGRDGERVIPTQQDRDEYLAGAKDLILYGRMTYTDIFGAHH